MPGVLIMRNEVCWDPRLGCKIAFQFKKDLFRLDASN